MCGIVFSASRTSSPLFIEKAHLAQIHRGPDGGATHSENVGGVELGFGHQRLSIVDLSAQGAQPMESRSKRYLIIFNGEIYNHRELVSQFNLGPLKSASDTEVAIELIEKIGLEEACKNFNGMWAIILLDRKEKRVSISRDRLGKKPLNYLANPHGVFFASEVRALASAPGFEFKVNAVTAARFLTQSLQNIDEETWVQGVKAFPAGHIAHIDLGSNVPTLGTAVPFWRPKLNETIPYRSNQEWIEELHATVRDAVRIRLVADVPVGIALSGGLDSSIIATVANEFKAETGQGVGLFSAVNPGSKDDESPFVDIMQAALGQEVHRYDLELDERQSLFNLLALCNNHNDGPVSSFSNVLFYKLMKQAKARGISVVLTGQGADEAFCGYRKYPFFYASQLLRRGHFVDSLVTLGRFLINDTVLKDASYAEFKRYLGRTSTGVMGPVTVDAFQPLSLSAASNLASRQWQDIAHLSVPYLCHYEDRMSMAASCEVRSPFLDYRVIELGLTIPDELKLNSGWTKFVLRKAFEEALPEKIAWRKDKKGFVNPQDRWLQKDLKHNVLEIMGDPSHPVFSEGLIEQRAFLKLFEDYCRGDSRIWFREVFAPFSLAVWIDQMKEFASIVSAEKQT